MDLSLLNLHLILLNCFIFIVLLFAESLWFILLLNFHHYHLFIEVQVLILNLYWYLWNLYCWEEAQLICSAYQKIHLYDLYCFSAFILRVVCCGSTCFICFGYHFNLLWYPRCYCFYSFLPTESTHLFYSLYGMFLQILILMKDMCYFLELNF